MKKKMFCLFVTALTFSGVALLTSCCSNDDNVVIDHHDVPTSTSLFVATDRHESGNGNHLTELLQVVVDNADVVTPGTVLLGGDYVGSGPDRGLLGQPTFSLEDMRSEIFSTLSSEETDVFFTYGSHDRNCKDNYRDFFSGPHRCDGYYVYGISYVHMAYDTDSLARAAVALYQTQGENTNESVGPPSEGGDGPGGGVPGGGGGNPQPPSGDLQSLKPYNGIDVVDSYGISSESAAASFTSWVSTLNDHAPIVVMSHMPIHAHRGDNPGGLRWFEALNRAAETHDVVLFFGHNHSMEERGDSLDQYYYLLTPGDSISVQGDKYQGVQRKCLRFTYANAGYIKLGRCTLVTYTDTDANGNYDQMQLRRFNVLGDDESHFGLTGKRNPYTMTLNHNSPGQKSKILNL